MSFLLSFPMVFLYGIVLGSWIGRPMCRKVVQFFNNVVYYLLLNEHDRDQMRREL